MRWCARGRPARSSRSRIEGAGAPRWRSRGRGELSPEALALDTGALERFDLLLTDVVMPDHAGPEVARVLAERHPSLPVLFMSGHLEDQLGALPEDADLLQQPFTADALLQRVRGALDGGG